MKNLVKQTVVAVAMAVVVLGVAGSVFAEDFYYKKSVGNSAPDLAGDDLYEQRESRTGFWIIGGGAMVNRMPIAASQYTLPIAFFAYESIYKNMLGPFDFSWSIGFYDLMPEIEFSAILPLKPFDLRFSAGAYYDLIIGGHAGLLLKGGVIINKYIGFDVLLIPIGTQPTVSYSQTMDQGRIVENDGEHGLDFPIFGAMITFRL